MFKALVAALLIGSALAGAASAETVRVRQGEVSGVADHGARAWLGLPFAAPPIGDLRWRSPAPVMPWTGVRPADHFGNDCRQGLTPEGLGPWTTEYMTAGPVSEDCLYLNVWAPADSGTKRPVLVWIHGGAFTSGSGAVPIYNGAALAKKGIIVVTLNYRLGVYGFLAHSDLSAEVTPHSSGNYGLLDQIAALQWVRDNIAAFGGDPDQVTVAGQSAGAASVHALLASPLARGLFHQAIAQSGSGMGGGFPALAAAERENSALLPAAGVASVADLRGLSADRLDAAVAEAGLRFIPLVDGVVVSDTANLNDVPVLTGMTANETSSNGFFHSDDLTPDSFRAFVTSTYGPEAGAILTLYPPGEDVATAKTSRDALARDRGLMAMDAWAENRLQTSHKPIYAYLWTHVEPGPESTRYKAFHSSDIPYVFGTLDASDRPFTAADRALSERAMGYWVNWVSTGNPNGTGATIWPAFTAADPMIAVISSEATQAAPILPAARLKVFKAFVTQGGFVSLF